MTEPGDMTSAETAALWRRFRVLDRAARSAAADDERAALDFAAYADGRPDEATAERVEAWLAAHPEALDDLAAARGPGDTAVPQRVIDRAAALVAGESTAARVIPFRRPAAPVAWRAHLARAAVAASLVLTGLVGFTLGSAVYAGAVPSVGAANGTMLDQPSGVFSDEGSAI